LLVQSNLPEQQKIDSVQAIVTEVQCNAPDCVPIETLVILYGIRAKWSGKILCPVSEVKEEDLKTLDLPKDWDLWISEQTSTHSSTGDKEQIPTSDTEDWFPDMTEFVLTKVSKMSADKKRAVANYLECLASTIRSDSTQVNAINQEKQINTNNSNITSSATVPTVVAMKPRESYVEKKKLEANPLLGRNEFTAPPVRHNKGVRQRGCPCCDPDNIDNIVDNLFLRTPP